MGTGRDVTAGQMESPAALVLDSYGRLSKSPDTGEFEKIETQWADNRGVIDRLGGVLGVELEDGLSAWRKGVRRPGWEKLLERVQSGASNGIVVWHTDRLFRQPRDLEKLIDLADKGSWSPARTAHVICPTRMTGSFCGSRSRSRRRSRMTSRGGCGAGSRPTASRVWATLVGRAGSAGLVET
jgi:hypothetical protein